jgi:hypothetical protein
MERIVMSTVTYDLRNPVHAMLGLFEQIEAQDLPPGIVELCSVGLTTGKLILSRINNILDYSQNEISRLRLNYVDFDPMTVVNECLALFRLQAARKNLALEPRIEGHIPLINSDRDRYRQIILNLVENSLKFTYVGSVEVILGYQDRRDVLTTTVRDTGIGIPEQARAGLFQLFGQSATSPQPNSQGMGLGLVVCKVLALALGGDIELKHQSQTGASFIFSIKNQHVSGSRLSLNHTRQPSRPKLGISTFHCHATSAASEDHAVVGEEPRHESTTKRVTGCQRKRRGLMLPDSRSPRQTSEEDKRLAERPTCCCNKVLLVDDDEINLFVLQKFLERLNMGADTVGGLYESIGKQWRTSNSQGLCGWRTEMLWRVSNHLYGHPDAGHGRHRSLESDPELSSTETALLGRCCRHWRRR